MRTDDPTLGLFPERRMTVFTTPRVNVVQSDEGFEVEVLGRTGLAYREGVRQVRADSEALNRPGAMMMYAQSLRSWSDGASISDEERRHIVDNITRAFL
ncbi:MAG TPA: hypothetical protein VEV39_00015, partial [Gemmatimonadales bacterium]|nr:hypothetical protein [Gemmatimonadales bacterium]